MSDVRKSRWGPNVRTRVFLSPEQNEWYDVKEDYGCLCLTTPIGNYDFLPARSKEAEKKVCLPGDQPNHRRDD